MRLAESLAGKRILLTGVTGFVGEALLHKLLRDVPGCTVVAMVRPKQGQTAADRVTKLLAKAIFADLPEGSADRVETLSGDLYDVPALPTDLAATSPVSAFTVATPYRAPDLPSAANATRTP